MVYKKVLERIQADAAAHKNALNAICIFLATALFFLYFAFVKEAIILAAFIALGAISRLWQRFFPAPIGANLIMLFAVISGAGYGSFAGMLVGIVSLIISSIMVQDDLATTAAPIFAMSVVGYLAGILSISASNISLWGLALTVLYDAVISVEHILLGRANINTVIFVVTHLVFNYFVFFTFAPEIMGLLA